MTTVLTGGGIWLPEPKALKRIRDSIVAEPDVWRTATAAGQSRIVCTMAGEALKRAPAGYDPHHPLIEDIKRRDFVIGSPLADSEVILPRFDEVVCRRLEAATPLARFVSRAVGVDD